MSLASSRFVRAAFVSLEAEEEGGQTKRGVAPDGVPGRRTRGTDGQYHTVGNRIIRWKEGMYVMLVSSVR